MSPDERRKLQQQYDAFAYRWWMLPAENRMTLADDKPTRLASTEPLLTPDAAAYLQSWFEREVR